MPPSDDAVRQALLRLGSGLRDPSPASRRPAAFSTGSVARRRFVQDGEVAVEYAERPRHPAQPGPADNSGLDELREALAQERQARAEAEAALRDAQAALHGCRTRLGHLELALEEARSQIAAQAQVAAQAHAQVVAEVPAATPDAPRRGRRPRPAEDADAPVAARAPRRRDAEPQPVKWWIKNAT